MSQVTDFVTPGTPLTMTGLKAFLDACFAAAVDGNRGSSAPSNPIEGMLWLDSSGGATAEVLKRYTVAGGWVPIMTFNITSGTITQLHGILDEDDMASDSAVLPPSQQSALAYFMAKTGANLAIGSDADGDMYTRTSGVLARIPKGAANLKMFMNAAGTTQEWASGVTVVASSRDNTAASGDVSYTGAGFKPSAIILLAQKEGAAHHSTGMWQGAVTNDRCSAWIYSGVTVGKTNIAWIQDGASDYQAADMKSVDADGCTLTWTKGGTTAAGTINMFFMYIR